MTVSRTRPPAITDCTSEIGASESAPTWRPQDAVAMTIPSVYARERNSMSVLRIGRSQRDRRATATAPRCL